MKTIGPPQVGKLGDMVASRNRYGPYQRKHFIPRKEPSPAQRNARDLWGLLAAAWERLTQAQRLLWHRAAAETPSRRRLGRAHRLIGSVLFQKLNYPRLLLGLPPLTEPTRRPNFPDNPVRELVITRTRIRLAIKLRVLGQPTPYILVFGSPPCKAGRSSCTTFCLLGLLPNPRRGLSEITRLYCQRYGAPPPGSRIFIRTKQHINGWEDRPVPTDAQVPPWPGTAPRPPFPLIPPPRPMK